MSTADQNILYFVSFCIEQYKHVKGLDGSVVMDLFEKNGVLNYLSDNFDVLHTQGANWLVEEIDEFLKNKMQ